MIKLIASDMDGTLLDQNKKLPEDFFEVLDKLHDKDINFVVASGRCYCTLHDNFSPYSDRLDYIADNGANIIINGRNVYTSLIERKYVTEIIKQYQALERKNVYVLLCGTKGTYYDHNCTKFSEEIFNYYLNRICVKDLTTIDDDIFKISIYDENGPENYSYPILNGIYKDRFNLEISGTYWVDIVNKDVNKGVALKRIQEMLDVSPDETMVFGDFYNDIKLLQQAKYSFVMKNANDDMFQYGNYVAEPNTENGVIKAIYQYAL